MTSGSDSANADSKKMEKDKGAPHLDFSPPNLSRKVAKRGFEFTIIVAGFSGLGKSTLINTLFNVDMFPNRQNFTGAQKIERTTEIKPSTLEIEERNIKMRLTVIDTPGFGDSINNSNCILPISTYLDEQFELYFKNETGLNRRNIIDTRVHCCLYFISPTGRGLKTLDIQTMKAIHNKVNIIPLIAKADTYTDAELKEMKKRVIQDIIDNDIRIYELPQMDPEDDPEFIQKNEELKKLVPFAVVGSVDTVDIGGKTLRGRSYPWGFVDVDDEKCCDFVPLRNMLLKSHTYDLKDITQDIHYENYRAIVLTQNTPDSLARRFNTTPLTEKSAKIPQDTMNKVNDSPRDAAFTSVSQNSSFITPTPSIN